MMAKRGGGGRSCAASGSLQSDYGIVNSPLPSRNDGHQMPRRGEEGGSAVPVSLAPMSSWQLFVSLVLSTNAKTQCRDAFATYVGGPWGRFGIFGPAATRSRATSSTLASPARASST